MERIYQLDECSTREGDMYRTKLEDQISEMWKTIEDLKHKVTEEKELVSKEKSENERMAREQATMRRQLSMFHLPHCPVLTSPPCPVHSVHSHPCREKRTRDTDDLFYGDQGVRRFEDLGMARYNSFIDDLKQHVERASEDVFKVDSPPLYVTSPSPSSDDVTSFTLHLTGNCQNRLREAQEQRVESGKKGPRVTAISQHNYQDHGEEYTFTSSDVQPLVPSQIIPNL